MYIGIPARRNVWPGGMVQALFAWPCFAHDTATVVGRLHGQAAAQRRSAVAGSAP